MASSSAIPRSVGLQIRRFVQRAVHFVRPQRVFMPLSLNDILGAQQGRHVVDQFSDLWYRSGVSGELSWRGDSLLKNPCDIWMVVELFQRLRPTVVVETGTHHGGSASFYADMLRMLEIPATVVTIDFNPKWSFDPATKGIVSVVGYSTDQGVHDRVKQIVAEATAKRQGPVMVMLDSDHSEENVSKELALYSPLVTIDSYLIVEDTNVNGHPSSPEFGPGPWEAVDKFLAAQSDFVADKECERFLLTFYPRGWLKRER